MDSVDLRPLQKFTFFNASFLSLDGQGKANGFMSLLMLRLLSLLIFLLGLSAVSATAQTVRTPGIDKDEINRRAEALMSQLELTGLAVAIVEDGKITMAEGYGEALRDSGKMVDADTVFRWASVSKGVASHLLVSMAADDEITLDKDAAELAPSLKLPPNETNITIEDLLAHKVGIVRNAYDSRIEDNKGAKETRNRLKDLSYKCAPATCHTYQNVAYDAASEIVETVKGLPYKSVVKTEVFDRFGMSTATASYEGLLQSNNWARPHGRFGDRIRRVKPTYYRVPAAAGINSSVKDLARWMVAQMPDESPDTLSKAETVQQSLQTPRVPTPREQRFLNRRFGQLTDAQYGLGFRVYDYAGNKVVGHRGGVEGYRALILFDPAKRTGIAMMWNSPHTRPIGLQLEFMDQLYGLPKRDWLRFNERR